MSDPRQRFTWLYDQYYRRVLRYALQHADPPSAEDVASETFLIAWRRLADVPEQPLPWLLVVAQPAPQAVRAGPQAATARGSHPCADQ